MTLFGLDLIVNQEGKPFLGEINGICSGMGGFRQIYGDTRVEDKVYQMLSERYGILTVNDGSYQQEKFKREHPLRHDWKKTVAKHPILRHLFDPPPKVWYSEKALLQWYFDEVKDTKMVSVPFDVYRGQDSTVMNVVNDTTLPHSLVNQYVAEAITRNKFLQYLVLKKTPVQHVLPPTTLVGLGYINDAEIAQLLATNNFFIQKPLLGKQGQGVLVLDTRGVKKFEHLSGAVYPQPFDSIPLRELFKWKNPGTFLEDLIDKKDFSFEMAMGIVQPFIDSAREIEGQHCYSSIRAIVCNGKFVDAYERYSPEKRVNLSQGAKARAYESDGLAEFCEYVTATFERECAALHPDTFKQQLYSAYLEKGGRRRWKETFISSISETALKYIEFTVRR